MSDHPVATRWLLLCYGFLVAIATTILWFLGGYNLNLLLCSSAVAGLMISPFAAHVGRLSGRVGLSMAGGMVLGGWWIACHPRGELQQAFRCMSVVTALLWADVELCGLLVSARLNGTIASALVTITTAVWLAWPLWTLAAPPLVVRLHPLLAIDGVVSGDLGIWTEQPVVYQWIALGQDTSYQLPNSVWPSVVAHSLFGLVTTTLGVGVNRMLRNT